MRTIGLDVCKSSVVACLLTELPSEPRQFYNDHSFPKFYANAEGLRNLLLLKPEVAVLEPTGVNYTKIWATKLAEAGVKVILVGHKQLRTHRENLGLPDKDDEGDALALACYYLQHWRSPLRFVRMRDPSIAQMRDTVLRLHHLNRLQSPVINRLRQDLAWQFPERAHTSLGARLFWRWLAGAAKSAKYEKQLAESIGLGIQQETRKNAQLLCEVQNREQHLELQLRSHLSDVRFLPYRKVFAQFGFGERTEALILSQIYPLENYLKDGKPEVIYRKGKVSGKPTKRHLSRRRFQKALGVAPTREWSGDDKSKSKKAGSALCRIALWQWVFTRIEPARSRPNTAIGQQLWKCFEAEKAVKPIKLARSRLFAKCVQLLFYELFKGMSQSLRQGND